MSVILEITTILIIQAQIVVYVGNVMLVVAAMGMGCLGTMPNKIALPSAEMGLFDLIKNVTTITQTLGMAVHPPVFKNLITIVLDNPATAQKHYLL